MGLFDLFKRGKKKAGASETGILFWFNWQKISDSGHANYGAYVYEHLLPYFSPKRQEFPIGFYYFFDGDFLPKSSVQIPYNGIEEARCMEEIKRQGPENCYIIAIYAMNPGVSFSDVDQGLRAENIIGYMGMTSCPQVDFEDFYDLTGEMMLQFAFTIRYGTRFEKKSFSFVIDDKLRSMGFEPSCSNN